MRRSSLVRRLTFLAMMLALGVLFHYIESFIPPLVPLPGVKLGLANLVSLIVLYYFTRREYVAVGSLRVLLVGLIATGLFSFGFFISAAGFVLSTLATLLVITLWKNASIYTISVTGAVFHMIGQVSCCALLYGQINMMKYLPIVLVPGIVAGFLIALVAAAVIGQLERAHFSVGLERK